MKHSIIVTGFNCELYAEECIRSILNQTYDNFEILIYNDGSVDSTKKVLEQFKSNKNIKIYNNKINQGALYGRYNLNKLAQGEIVSFVGLDDKLRSDALEIVNSYYTPKIKMTYGNWVDMDTNFVFDVEEYSEETFELKLFRKTKWKATALNTFRKSLIDMIPETILKMDGNFFTNCTDLAYSYPCLEQCSKDEVAVIKEPIYIYRKNHPNTTLKRLGKINKTIVRKYLSNQNIFKK